MPKRYTDDVVEYVRNVSVDFPIEQSLRLVRLYTGNSDMTENELIDLCNNYKIDSFRQGDYGLFTLKEVRYINQSIDGCRTLYNVYLRFVNVFPNKFKSYEDFCEQAKELEVIKVFNEAHGIDITKEEIKEEGDNMNMFEINFIQDRIKEGLSESEVYDAYKRKFPNTTMSYVEFGEHFDLVKNYKEEKGRQSIEFTESDIDLLNKLANGNRTRGQIYTEFTNISKTKIGIYSFNKKIQDLGLNIPDGRVGAKAIEFTKEDEDLIRKLADGENTVASAMTIFNKEASVEVSYPTFLRRIKALGLHDKFAYSRANARKNHPSQTIVKDSNKKGGRKSMYSPEFIKELSELYMVHSLPKCIEIMRTWKKYDDVLYGGNVPHKLSQLLSREGIKNGKRGSERQKNTIKSDIKNVILDLAKEHTAGEVYDILVKDYNYSSKSHKTFASTQKKLGVEFKVYDVVTDTDNEILKSLYQSGLDGRDLITEFHSKVPHRYTNAVLYRALTKIKENKPDIKEIVIHKLDEPKDIHIVEELPEDNMPEVEQVVAWHSDEPKDKYQPIIDEVVGVFERKCKQLKVDTDTHDRTGDLINALKIIIQYAEDSKGLVKNCVDQEDIIEQYRREIDHEIENLPFSDTDTTLQNKIKVLRMMRRGIKNTKEDVDLMNPITNMISHNLPKFKTVLESLERKREERENFIFIPLVDTTMITKYDWCKQGTLANKRSYVPVLTTNNNANKAEAKKKSSNMNKYRVKAEFMAFGDGKPFTAKYYDIYATSEEHAKENSKPFFDNLSKLHNNSRYTIQEAHIVNI